MELHQQGPAGRGAGEPDRLRGGLGPAHRRDHHLGRRDNVDDPRGQLDLELGDAEAEQVDGADGLAYGIVDEGRVVTEQDRPERGVVVEVLAAVEVHHVGAVATSERVRVTHVPGGGVDAARNHLARGLVQGPSLSGGTVCVAVVGGCRADSR